MSEKSRCVSAVFLALIVCTNPLKGENVDFGYDVPDWTFCVAYVFRDSDEREEREKVKKDLEDPFARGSPAFMSQGSLLVKDGIIDVAGLTSRKTEQKTLSINSTHGVLRAVLNGNAKHSLTSCYDPHHIFVFYNSRGVPVYSIEVCFSCNRVRMVPELKDTRGFGNTETADLLSLAKILDDAKISLTPIKSYEEFVERVAEDMRSKKKAEQVGAAKTDP